MQSGKNPLLCDAAQSVLNMGYLPRVVKKCLDELLKLEGWHSMSGKKLMKIIMDKEDVGDLDPVLSVVPTQRPPKRKCTEMSVPKPKAVLEQENAALKERTTCKICLLNIVSIVFLPCGHLVSCAQCAPALKVCPICRGPMKATVRISFA
ncbi:baculoviral IAP repeat-containing protein 7-like [Pecten maximus]|uniref:baculoviral IAP repeat-containing protein 7-like n=1 Tax=Pecten maximus TaxID=6579 RepID=UPI001458801B|nr:baculoviral IAP repeat-containing protein 7-like [Pecten maximus]